MMKNFSRWASIAPGQANLTWARSRPRIWPSAPAPGARGCPPPSCCTCSTDFLYGYSSRCFWPYPKRVVRDSSCDWVYMPEGLLWWTVWLLVNQARLAALNLLVSARQRTSHVHTARCLPCWNQGTAPKQKQARILKTLTKVAPVVFLFSAVNVLDKVFVFFQMKFSPARRCAAQPTCAPWLKMLDGRWCRNVRSTK